LHYGASLFDSKTIVSRPTLIAARLIPILFACVKHVCLTAYTCTLGMHQSEGSRHQKQSGQEPAGIMERLPWLLMPSSRRVLCIGT